MGSYFEIKNLHYKKILRIYLDTLYDFIISLVRLIMIQL